MLPNRFAEVVLELPLALNGLLWNVGVSAELRADRESDKRGSRGAVDQVVPILPPRSELVEQGRREHGVQRDVSNLQVILGEIAFCQIEEAIALVVEAVIGLRRDR